MFEKQHIQSISRRFDADIVARKLGPYALAEEACFGSVALIKCVIALMEASILEKMPA